MDTPQLRLRHQNVIVTLYGLYCRNDLKALPVATLIRLLGDLGYDAQGVRSAVSRLKRKGVLESIKVNSAAGYRLTDEVQPLFSEGDSRIFAEHPPGHGTEWVLATFSVPESQRRFRHQIRRTLTSLGFGTVSAALWIAPTSNAEEAMAVLARHGLDQYVEFFRGHYINADTLSRRVREWWDLPAMIALNQAFLDQHADEAREWRRQITPSTSAAAISPALCERAYRFYVPMLTMWRQLPYTIPLINPELLPDDWNGERARSLFVGTHRLIAPLAERHVQHVIRDTTHAAA